MPPFHPLFIYLLIYFLFCLFDVLRIGDDALSDKGSILNSSLVTCHVRMDLLVRAAFKVVLLELAMSSIFLGLSFLGGPP